MPIVTREAELQLNFVVVGGGVGGLAVAYMLSSAGHRVIVIERRNHDIPSGGLRVPPNMSKILRQWVGEEELRKVSTLCARTPFYQLEGGEFLGYLHWKPAVMAETGGQFLLMHRSDLIRLLHDLAVRAGAQVLFDTEAVSVRSGQDGDCRANVKLSNGQTISADLVIGADGCQSITRKVVLENELSEDLNDLTIHSGFVPEEGMLKDSVLERLLQADEWPCWVGEHTCFFGHPVRAKKEFWFARFSWRQASDGLEKKGVENWDEILPIAKSVGSHDPPTVRRLVENSAQVIRSQWMHHQETETWVDQTGRIVLLGEAAHPTYPGATHAASMAVEDAAVLGSLFSHLNTADQIPTLLSAYQELRQARCDLVRQAEVDNMYLLCFPAGPLAEARNANFSRSLDAWDDEGTLKAQFEELREIFAYDAGDAAEEWWINWGRFQRRHFDPPSPRCTTP